jgi:hypothetical protein
MDLVHVLASLLNRTHQRCGRVIRRLPPRAPDGSCVSRPVDGWIVRGFHNYGWRPGQPLWLKWLPLFLKKEFNNVAKSQCRSRVKRRSLNRLGKAQHHRAVKESEITCFQNKESTPYKAAGRSALRRAPNRCR